MKAALVGFVKNFLGWKTKRKIVVFSVDDYGNVRLDSKSARKNMDNAEMQIYSRFDLLDSLETKQDLEQLYDVLDSVKDKNGKAAIFTAFSMPCNIDFEKMKLHNYETFYFEPLPTTYQKLSKKYPEAYEGAWEMWQQGMERKLIKPQFHGREHLNLTVFNQKLKKGDVQLLTALQNRSYSSIADDTFPTMASTAAFDFWDFKENIEFTPRIIDGLQWFEKVFGFKSNYFTPPVFNIHNSHYKTLKENGINFIDLAFVRKQHQGLGKYKSSINFIGKSTKEGLTTMVRNALFEPTDESREDWVEYTMKQIETAFKYKKPAIISSHRVNFCGHIDPDNRKKGLSSLRMLLSKIVEKWPEVEFMSADELGEIVVGERF